MPGRSALLVRVGLGGAERLKAFDQFLARDGVAFGRAGAEEDVRMKSEVLIGLALYFLIVFGELEECERSKRKLLPPAELPKLVVYKGFCLRAWINLLLDGSLHNFI